MSIASSARSSRVHQVGGGVELGGGERGERGAAAGDDADGLEELGRLGLLVDEAGRAGDAGEEPEGRFGLRGVDDHLRRVLERAQAAGQRRAVAVGQAVLAKHHVRFAARDEVCSAVRPGCRSDGHEARLGAQQHREPGPRGGLGIDDGDARHGRDDPSRV